MGEARKSKWLEGCFFFLLVFVVGVVFVHE
jgi:hypothetical protein